MTLWVPADQVWPGLELYPDTFFVYESTDELGTDLLLLATVAAQTTPGYVGLDIPREMRRGLNVYWLAFDAAGDTYWCDHSLQVDWDWLMEFDEREAVPWPTLR